MAFHIPFEHRQRNRKQYGPIYIGFDVPSPRPRRKFNWWGFHGLWLSLASFLTAGLLSPIPLIISLVGLRKGPGRKMAAAGTIFSILGTGLFLSLVFGSISHDQHRRHIAHVQHQKHVVSKQVETTEAMMEVASKELTEFRDANNGKLPNWVDCNMLMIKHEDPWGKSLRFDADAEDWGTLRSAGPDSQFDTGDDLTQRIDGQTDRETASLD
jgi:hypothetical protein